MSQYIDTATGSLGEATPPSAGRRWTIAAGIAVAVALGALAVGLYNGASPTAERAPAAQAEATLSPQEIAGLRAEAMVEHFAGQTQPVTQGALDPFEAQFVSPQLQSAVGAASVLSPQEIAGLRAEAMVEHFARQASGSGSGTVDPFEAQTAPTATQVAVGVGGGLSPQEIAGLRAEAMVEHFARQSGETTGSSSRSVQYR